jgi:hypothetical protein
MKTILFATLVLFTASSQAIAQPRAERILGYLPTRQGIIFQVPSGGCTRRGDFVTRVTRSEASPVAALLLLRMRPDLCYPFIPTGERFEFTYAELGIDSGEKFTVKNENGVVLGWIWPDSQN